MKKPKIYSLKKLSLLPVGYPSSPYISHPYDSHRFELPSIHSVSKLRKIKSVNTGLVRYRSTVRKKKKISESASPFKTREADREKNGYLRSKKRSLGEKGMKGINAKVFYSPYVLNVRKFPSKKIKSRKKAIRLKPITMSK